MLARLVAPGGRPRVLVCSGRARAAFAALLADARPHVPVLAVGELAAAGLERPSCRTIEW
jgi:type III secretion protein V